MVITKKPSGFDQAAYEIAVKWDRRFIFFSRYEYGAQQKTNLEIKKRMLRPKCLRFIYYCMQPFEFLCKLVTTIAADDRRLGCWASSMMRVLESNEET